jgi:hypothetical protein
MRTMGWTFRAVTIVAAVPITWLVPASPAHAATPQRQRVVCEANGEESIYNGRFDVFAWEFAGSGTCVPVDAVGPVAPRSIHINISGTPAMLGCPNVQPSFTMRGWVTFDIGWIGELFYFGTWHEQWAAPLALYPGATVFSTSNPEGVPTGGGMVVTRIFGKCPPAGSYAARAFWTSDVDVYTETR